ncbi:MAG TPA: penicillin acylase family protein [Bryobacteraceae bacterium]|jgi:penicillin amidase|nr:penicillin acylase family protein [Bryobacteraceae bacterium]
MTRRTILSITVFLAALALPVSAATQPTLIAKSVIAKSVTIYRDNYGVPHVFGPTDASCIFGYIYAQAEDNFWQIEDSYIRALGRASEVYGAKTLDDDRLVRALQIPKLAQAEYDRATPETKKLVDASAEGLNYFLARNLQVKPRLITHFEPWYIYAFNRYALYYKFIFGKSGLKPSEISSASESQGSNMWAITPAKSADGHALLFINPHQPFFGVGQWYEGHVHSDEGWNMSGASFFGSGFPTIGHNEVLGWSHTVNEPDIVDVYEETFDNPSDPLAYRYDGAYKHATEWKESIKVKTDTGFTEPTFTFRRTHHGPIVAKRNGKPLAVKMAKFEEGGQVDEWYAMSKARNFDEFKKAMSAVAVPMFNAIYADRDGNIFYVYNGAVPKRSLKFDWSKPVDGSTSETEWQGYHSFNELPQVTNPKSGFVQNCNSTPFTTTVFGNPDPSEYPKYMVGEQDTARARISRRILWNKDKFSFDEWAKAGFDTYVINAETEIPKLVEAFEQEHPAKLLDPITELRNWDHVSRVSSVPMTLFLLYHEKQYGTAVFPAAKPKETPLESLEKVVDTLQKTFGTWRVPYGDINRLERRQSGGEEPFSDAVNSLPIAGAPGDVGIVFNFYSRPEKDQKHRYGVAGHSFISVVDFGPQVEARSILVFGENSDPNSKHYFDQSQLYAKQEFKPAYFSLADVKSHAERTYHPGEGKP